MPVFFGTDGFRGRAGEKLTAAHAFSAGLFLGHYFGAARSKRCRAVIGKDTRRSSYMLEYALVAGLTAAGADAYMMHVTTTPSVAYAVRAFSFDCGIVVSASHNGFCDNGIKLLGADGEKPGDEVIAPLEACLAGGGSVPFATDERVGSAVDFVSGRNNYCEHLLSLFPRSLAGYRIGLDCANGGAYNIARRVFRGLGASVAAIGCRPDGVNINRGCGSTSPDKLGALVRERGLDVGFAFDGDGDRCICTDECGNVVDGDGILYILSRYLKERGRLPGNRIVATVMSNSGLACSLKEQGIAVEECPVGDRFVHEKMLACGAALGGEQSGHIIVGELENTGDGIVTALCLAQVLAESGGKFSSLLGGLELYPQVCVSVSVKDKARALSPDVLRERARAEELLGGEGRVLVRASGTEEVVRIMAECRDKCLCNAICSALVGAVRED